MVHQLLAPLTIIVAFLQEIYNAWTDYPSTSR